MFLDIFSVQGQFLWAYVEQTGLIEMQFFYVLKKITKLP